MMKILIATKQNYNERPPILSLKSALNDLGYQVDLLALNVKSSSNIGETFYSVGTTKPLEGLIWYFKFAYRFYRLLASQNYDILIIHGGDFIHRFGWLLSKNNRAKMYVQLNELYDKHPAILYSIRKYKKNFDKVIVPEIHRAFILKSLLGLNKLPDILMNKPYPDLPESLSTVEALQKVTSFNYDMLQKAVGLGKTLLLYQGILNQERDVSKIAQLSSDNPDVIFLIMGRGDVDYLKNNILTLRNVIYLGYAPPPLHLIVARYCDAGIIIYDDKSLNKVFSAPNKIWEYAAQGIPVLYSKSLSISFLVRGYRFASECDFSDPEHFRERLSYFRDNKELLREDAFLFYRNYDYLSELKNILTN